MGSLAGKVAIVTGSSRGIGRAIAERLAEDGAAVVVNCRSSEGESREVVGGIVERGGQAAAIIADIGQVPDIRRMFRETIERFGRIDILVNNSAIAPINPIAQ